MLVNPAKFRHAGVLQVILLRSSNSRNDVQRKQIGLAEMGGGDSYFRFFCGNDKFSFMLCSLPSERPRRHSEKFGIDNILAFSFFQTSCTLAIISVNQRKFLASKAC